MRITVISNEKRFIELTETNQNINWLKATSLKQIDEIDSVDVVINLNEDAFFEDYKGLKIPVLINSVSNTLKTSEHGAHVIRVNGWNGFLKRTTWELAGENSDIIKELSAQLGVRFSFLSDEPGFVSARVLAMIINEAYFAKAENVSTEHEINIALKLGTNYPKGPFEWANEIGLHNVLTLLKTLSIVDARYIPSTLLEKEANKL
jgi:3-hydroxybutyryl-CoA dehydrogenase